MYVKKIYRKQGIGSSLLKKLEEYFKANGRKKISAAYFLPSCYPWYIPNTDNHDHPCAPGIRVNSNEYFFYIHRGYEPNSYQDAFHLNLSDYELSDEIKDILEEFDDTVKQAVSDYIEQMYENGELQDIIVNTLREHFNEVNEKPHIKINPIKDDAIPNVSPIAAECIRFNTYLKRNTPNI